MREMRVLFPALGNPTRATSAMSRSSTSSQRSSPGSPCSANDGARRRLVRKRALPRPPRPPRAASQVSPSCTRSAMTVPSFSLTVVPSGTETRVSEQLAPCRPPPWPWTPFVARRQGWSLKPSSDATLRSATSHTSPPLPPSPPSGPPFGTCASRRNDTAPAPPSPPRTCRPASSTNWDMRKAYELPVLAMTDPGKRALVIARTKEQWLQDVDELGALGLPRHACCHRRPGQVGGDGHDGVTVDDQDGRERDLLALALAEQLDVETLALLDARLLPARADDCVHSAVRLSKLR